MSMSKQIISFINQIKENTGIKISVFSQTGELIFGENENIKINPSDNIFKKGYSASETYFKFNFLKNVYIACINYVGEQAKSYAYLITQLANKTSVDNSLTKEQFVYKILLGEIDFAQVKTYAKKYEILDKSYFVMAISFNGKTQKELIDFLSSYGETGDFYSVYDQKTIVFAKSCKNDIGDYYSTTEYAEFLSLSILEEMGYRVKIGVGGIVTGLEKVSQSFNQALTTLELMQTLGVKGDIHAYKEFILFKIVDDIPKNKAHEYLKLLTDAVSEEVFKDNELLDTAEAFLDNNLNSSETSRKLFLHRNTLKYRLDKLENLTGLNIRKFSDAVTFRLLTILIKFVR